MKTILAYVNGTTGDRAVLATALQVGRLFNAHLHCLHVQPDHGSLVSRATNVDLTSAMVVTDAIRALDAEAAKRVTHAREIFFAFCEDEHLPHLEAPQETASVSTSWHENLAKPVNAFVKEARFHDLVVVEGGARRDLILSEDDVGELIVSAGRPVLLVPPTARRGGLKSIAIAWKNCPEASRAITGAMPLLERAERIIVLSASENEDKSDATVESLNNVMSQLRWHGLRAEGCCVVRGSRSIPDAVLETARESEVDLLVMGAFGHSRIREFVFGGFTQRVLDGTDVPVLLFH